MRNWAALDAWKAAVAKGETPPEGNLRKALIADEIKQVEGEARAIQFTISTGSVDRDKDTVNPDGWKLAAYKKNPVVQWAHDYKAPPIARAPKIKIQDGKLVSTAEFVPGEVYPFAEMIFQMVKGGFLNATSVGFHASKWNFNEDRRGVDFLEQELLEFSVVPVPANPEALVEARSAGIDVEPLKEWAQEIMDRLSPEPGLWLPKETVERALKALGSAPFTSLSAGTSTAANVVLVRGDVRPASPLIVPVSVPMTAGASSVAVTAVAKQKPECPKGMDCPNTTNSAGCPMGKDCPMMANAMTSLETGRLKERDAILDELSMRDVRAERLILEVLEVPEIITHGLILDMADEPDTYDEALVRQLLAESVAESIMPMVAREVREAMTALTGRLD